MYLTYNKKHDLNLDYALQSLTYEHEVFAKVN